MFFKYWFVILAIITLAGLVAVFYYVAKSNSFAAEVEEYREYLLTLTAEEVIREHFKNKNQKKIIKLRETVVDNYKSLDWGLNNLEYIEILEISVNDHSTEIFREHLGENGINYEEAKVFDVTYNVKYIRSGPQDSGTHIWKYNMIKYFVHEHWLIESFGF